MALDGEGRVCVDPDGMQQGGDLGSSSSPTPLISEIPRPPKALLGWSIEKTPLSFASLWIRTRRGA